MEIALFPIAEIPGQLDLADAIADATAATVTAHVAIGDNGSNVYLDGETCRRCDRRFFDPQACTGIPCQSAALHAAEAAFSWNQTTGWQAHAFVTTVTVPAGERWTVVAAAQSAAAAVRETARAEFAAMLAAQRAARRCTSTGTSRTGSAVMPAPAGALWDVAELCGQMVLA